MASKKGSKRGGKKVSVEVDEASLRKLQDALNSLSELASAFIFVAPGSTAAKKRTTRRKKKK